jgi:hypothetical protein
MTGLALGAYLVGLRGAIPLALRVMPLPTLFDWISPRRVSTSESAARRAIGRSQTVARHMRLPDTCLYRAAARFVALRSAGLPAQFVMAVRRDQPELGHAWVEIHGVPVDEKVDDRLVPTFRYPASAP